MNRVFKFFIPLLFVFTIFANTGALARYELPAGYMSSEEAADKAVNTARQETLNAIKALQIVIREFKSIIDNGKEDDKVFQEMLDKIREYEKALDDKKASNDSSSSSASGSNVPDWARRSLAHIASEKGNGFKKLDKQTVSKLVAAIEQNIPGAATDNKWAPILGAAKKAMNS